LRSRGDHIGTKTHRRGATHGGQGTGADPIAVSPEPVRHRRRIPPVSVRTLLVLVVLVPLGATFGFASAASAHQWTSRDQAISARRTSLGFDTLMYASAAVTREYVSAAAIVYAANHHIPVGVLDQLLGIHFDKQLAVAEKGVDSQPILRTGGLGTYYAKLLELRQQVAAGTTSFATVQALFQGFTKQIDTRAVSALDALGNGSDSSAPQAVRNDVAATRLAFSAIVAGLQQVTYAQAVLTTTATTIQIADLIASNEQYHSAVVGFPSALGPDARAAWATMQHSGALRPFGPAIALAVKVGLEHGPPPFATDLKKNASFFRADVARVTDLTNLVLAASADLRTTTAAQEASATNGLEFDIGVLIFFIILAIGGALLLARSVGQPLDRIMDAAHSIRAGEFDLQPLDETGPRELGAAAAAFNEMTSTLRAVEAHAVALASGDLDDAMLQTPLPGPTGQALQTALDQLQGAVRESERQREELNVRATHDSLTGLLNRGAAVEAIERDIARARREEGAVALLFVDLDGLKRINDTYGHEAGDAAIVSAANALRCTTRHSDIVSRLGGDEFIVAWIAQDDHTSPLRVGERIRQEVEKSFAVVGRDRIKLGCSIGVAVSEPAEAVDSLLKRADEALYAAKAEGRNRVKWLPAPNDRGAPVDNEAASSGAT
jgi:diguanylate cyclase (GGDEF)-like protein